MASEIQVEIISKKIIKPSSPTPNHLQNYKLSFFDQIAEKSHVPFVLFYPYDPIKNKNSTTDSMIQKLEESLSRVLTHVYPAAGRFHENKCSIICQDQGVQLIKVKVNRRMDEEFLKQAHNNLDLALQFWPQGIKDVDATKLVATPIMFFQIAIFQCGGITLSTSATHFAIDGWTNFTLIYEWSKVCKFGTPAEKINFMSFDLANIFGPRDIKFSDETEPLVTKLVAKKFVMDEVSVSNLRDELTKCNNSSRSLYFKPSRVEIITAILWRALLRASHAITGKMKPSVLSFPLSLRGKLKYRETINPFGNFIIEIPINYEPKGCDIELQNFIILIRETVQKTVDFVSEASVDEVVAMVENLYNKSYGGTEWGASDDVEEFACSSLNRFHMQEADFGWGNPNLMHFGSRDNQVFWLYSTQCGNNIVVQMDLKEKYMDFIQHDQEFLAFTKLSYG
ncbi:acetyl-CoA-benzylalcohol acetyltransferase [Capsicum galapagoense]